MKNTLKHLVVLLSGIIAVVIATSSSAAVTAPRPEPLISAMDCEIPCHTCVNNAKDPQGKNACVAQYSGCCVAAGKKSMSGWTCICQ